MSGTELQARRIAREQRSGVSSARGALRGGPPRKGVECSDCQETDTVGDERIHFHRRALLVRAARRAELGCSVGSGDVLVLDANSGLPVADGISRQRAQFLYERDASGQGLRCLPRAIQNLITGTINDTTGTITDTTGTINNTTGTINDTINDTTGTINDTAGTINNTTDTINATGHHQRHHGTITDTTDTITDTTGTINDTGTITDTTDTINDTNDTAAPREQRRRTLMWRAMTNHHEDLGGDRPAKGGALVSGAEGYDLPADPRAGGCRAVGDRANVGASRSAGSEAFGGAAGARHRQGPERERAAAGPNKALAGHSVGSGGHRDWRRSWRALGKVGLLVHEPSERSLKGADAAHTVTYLVHFAKSWHWLRKQPRVPFDPFRDEMTKSHTITCLFALCNVAGSGVVGR
ncbi:hypothetical protein CYMTET_21727, partial [Cymbomonas tetramitiformis]